MSCASRSRTGEVVAPLGTGLTDDQAALLQRHTSHVILLYDSDDPGLAPHSAPAMCCCATTARQRPRPCGRRGPDTLVQNKRRGRARAGAQGFGRRARAEDPDPRAQRLLWSLPAEGERWIDCWPTIRAAADRLRAICTSLALQKWLESGRTCCSGMDPRSKVPPPTAPTASYQYRPAIQCGKVSPAVDDVRRPWKSRVIDAVDSEEIEFAVYRSCSRR